jgi:hypothetical protein
MATASGKVKAALAAIEAAGRALNAVDECAAEVEAVQGVLDIRRSELADVEARLARANEEFAKDDAAHSDWRQKATKEQAAGNARINQLHEKLRVLEGQVAERRAEHDSIVAGMAALSQRLKV